MPGYSVNSPDIVTTNVLCLHCELVLRKPRQITECGHLYCEECLKEIIISSAGKCVVKECGATIQRIEQSFIDRAIERDIWKLPVLCDYKECDWSGTLRELVKVHKNECKFSKINCDLCKNPVAKCDMKAHIECCLKMPAVCPNCSENMLREQLGQHMEFICINRKMSCKYEPVGCPTKENKKDLVEHCREDVTSHLTMVHNKVEDLLQSVSLTSTTPPSGEAENTQDKCQELVRDIKQIQILYGQVNADREVARSKAEKLKSNGPTKTRKPVPKEVITDIEIKLNNLEARSKNFPTLKVGVDALLDSTKGQIETYETEKTQNREKLEQLRRQLMQIDTQVMLRDQALKEKKNDIDMLEKATYNGVLHWRIDNFAQRRQDAISGRTLSFYSHYFYSGRHGYKMRARIYLNGDGQGKGSHVSIFFVMCKGEFDVIQKWPFQYKITMSILDQNGKQHVTDAFRPNPTSASFQRPKTPMNIASGIPQFMPLTQILDSNQFYVKEDTMFVKVSIDLY